VIVSIHQTNYHRITQFQHPAVTLLATVPTAAHPTPCSTSMLPDCQCVLTGSPCLHMWRPGYRLNKSIMIMEHPSKVIKSWSQSLLAKWQLSWWRRRIACNSTCQHKDNVLTIGIVWYTYMLCLSFSVTNLMSSTECHIDFWIGPHWLTGFWQNPTAYRCWFISLFSSGISGSVTSWLLPGSLPPTCRRLKNVRGYRSLGRSLITSEEWRSDQP